MPLSERTRLGRQEARMKNPPHPISDVVRNYIETRLTMGRSPKAAMTALNSLVGMHPEDIHQRAKGWERLSGQQPLTLVDARRIYDAFRKNKSKAEFNQRRVEQLGFYRQGDIEDHAYWQLYPNERPSKVFPRRAVHDSGMLYRVANVAPSEAMEGEWSRVSP